MQAMMTKTIENHRITWANNGSIYFSREFHTELIIGCTDCGEIIKGGVE